MTRAEQAAPMRRYIDRGDDMTIGVKMPTGMVDDHTCRSNVRRIGLPSASLIAIARASKFAALPGVALAGLIIPPTGVRAVEVSRALQAPLNSVSHLFAARDPGPIIRIQLISDAELAAQARTRAVPAPHAVQPSADAAMTNSIAGTMPPLSTQDRSAGRRSSATAQDRPARSAEAPHPVLQEQAKADLASLIGETAERSRQALFGGLNALVLGAHRTGAMREQALHGHSHIAPRRSHPLDHSPHLDLDAVAKPAFAQVRKLALRARERVTNLDHFAFGEEMFIPIAVDIDTVLSWEEPASRAALHELASRPESLPMLAEEAGDGQDMIAGLVADLVPVSGPGAALRSPPAAISAKAAAYDVSAALAHQVEITAAWFGVIFAKLRHALGDGEQQVPDALSAGQSYSPVGAGSQQGTLTGNEAPAARFGAENQFMLAANGLATSLQGAASAAGAGNSGTQASLTATGSAGFDSNPFLSDRQNPRAASLRLQLAPVITRRDARNSFRAAGRFEHIEYLGRYASLQNYGADLAAVHRASEKLQLNAAALVRSDILATDLTNPLGDVQVPDPLAPVIPVIPGGNDVTILGQQQRRTQYGADGGLAYTLSPRDELRWSLSLRADRFGNNQLSDSNFYSQQLSYSRQVSEAVRIGAVIDGSIIEFPGSAFGDARTLTPQALVTVKLDERLRATGTAGLAFTRLELPTGTETTTAFAGNLSLCYGATRSSLCLTGARQVLPSAIGGARVQTTGGISYSLRVTERDTLQLGGNYATASEPLALAGDDFQSINAFARYERRLNERMRLFANGGYIETSGNGLEASNIQAVVGISITFGRNQ